MLITHDKSGRLTLDGMRAAIANKGSFMYKGQIISSLSDPAFPTAAQLAADSGDDSEVSRAIAENNVIIAKAKAENEKLKAQATELEKPEVKVAEVKSSEKKVVTPAAPPPTAAAAAGWTPPTTK